MEIHVGDLVRYPPETHMPPVQTIYKVVRVEKNYYYRGTTGDWIFTDKNDHLMSDCLLSDDNVEYLEWCRPTRKPTVIFI